MIASGVAFTLFLSLSKVQSAEYSPGFLAFWRAAVALLITLPVIFRQGLGVLKVHQPGFVFLRSVFGTLGFVFGFYAVSDAVGLPLSEFNAVSFSRAMFITLLAATLLKEKVGVHRWGATFAGFLGVLIMMQPQLGLSPGMLLALGAAFSLAGAITLVKTLSRRHKPVTLLIWANILSAAMLLPLALWKWPDAMPPWQDWGVIALMGAGGAVAQYCYIRAMSIGDVSFLSPMDYLRLPMAACVDWMVFHSLPGIWTWVGVVVIVGATLYITLRERFRRKPPPVEPL